MELYKERIIDGSSLAKDIKEKLKNRIITRQQCKHFYPHSQISIFVIKSLTISNYVAHQFRHHKRPMLGYVLVGNHADSALYVKMKKRACDEMGIGYEGFHFNSNVSQSQLNECVTRMTSDPKISGIIVQLPLPIHINSNEVLELISPEKDVDCLHPLNIECE